MFIAGFPAGPPETNCWVLAGGPVGASRRDCLVIDPGVDAVPQLTELLAQHGRTDLPGGSYASLLDSLRRVVLPAGDQTVVHPGHGPSTTVGHERQTNPYLQLASQT